MNELFASSAVIGVVVSLAAYGVGVVLKKKWKYSIFNPLLIANILVIGLLLLLRVEYQVYYRSAQYLSYLLTPVTVCLAIPLYQQLDQLKRNLPAILTGVLSGVLAGLASIFAMSKLFSLSHEVYVSLLPKSITTAIGMGVTEELGGYVPITIAAIVITGIGGNMMAPFLCRIFRITHPVARGVAIGTSAHAIGTARAMEMGETEGAMSSLAIVVAGLLTVIAASFFAQAL